ncbi:SPT3 Dosage dependent suppressor of Ty-induced promoter mutations-like protein [Blastocladiella emersonii ATCC 22665]|nr:SPT3 Dosage dependent suppressor of Ty-induced promoter mutations-like protein [Blastocladiella emersonii ATCC 22665]
MIAINNAKQAQQQAAQEKPRLSMAMPSPPSPASMFRASAAALALQSSGSAPSSASATPSPAAAVVHLAPGAAVDYFSIPVSGPSSDPFMSPVATASSGASSAAALYLPYPTPGEPQLQLHFAHHVPAAPAPPAADSATSSSVPMTFAGAAAQAFAMSAQLQLQHNLQQHAQQQHAQHAQLFLPIHPSSSSQSIPSAATSLALPPTPITASMPADHLAQPTAIYAVTPATHPHLFAPAAPVSNAQQQQPQQQFVAHPVFGLTAMPPASAHFQHHAHQSVSPPLSAVAPAAAPDTTATTTTTGRPAPLLKSGKTSPGPHGSGASNTAPVSPSTSSAASPAAHSAAAAVAAAATTTLAAGSERLPYQIRILGIPAIGAKSRVETQIKLCLQLVSPAGDKVTRFPRLRIPDILIANERWRRLAGGSTSAVATSAKGVANAAADAADFEAANDTDALWLHGRVVCASDVDKTVAVCKSCVQRETKRAQRKKTPPKPAAPGLPPSPPSSTTGSPDPRAAAISQQPSSSSSHAVPDIAMSDRKVLLINAPPVMDFASGDIILPTRIPCYCRHHREKIGFLIVFELRDHRGIQVAQGISAPILITDDHKSVHKVRRPSATPASAAEAAAASAAAVVEQQQAAAEPVAQPVHSLPSAMFDANGNFVINNDAAVAALMLGGAGSGAASAASSIPPTPTTGMTPVVGMSPTLTPQKRPRSSPSESSSAAAAAEQAHASAMMMHRVMYLPGCGPAMDTGAASSHAIPVSSWITPGSILATSQAAVPVAVDDMQGIVANDHPASPTGGFDGVGDLPSPASSATAARTSPAAADSDSDADDALHRPGGNKRMRANDGSAVATATSAAPVGNLVFAPLPPSMAAAGPDASAGTGNGGGPKGLQLFLPPASAVPQSAMPTTISPSVLAFGNAAAAASQHQAEAASPFAPFFGFPTQNSVFGPASSPDPAVAPSNSSTPGPTGGNTSFVATSAPYLQFQLPTPPGSVPALVLPVDTAPAANNSFAAAMHSHGVLSTMAGMFSQHQQPLQHPMQQQPQQPIPIAQFIQSISALNAAMPVNAGGAGAAAPTAVLPKIERVVPAEGPIQGGIEVTILGTGFNESLTVQFGSVPASTVYWSPNTLVCMLPPGAHPGAVPVCIKQVVDLGLSEPAAADKVTFTYQDDTDRRLIEIALTLLGYNLDGKLDSARDVAARVLNGSYANPLAAAAAAANGHNGGRQATLASIYDLLADANDAHPTEQLAIRALARLAAEHGDGDLAALLGAAHGRAADTLLHLAVANRYAHLAAWLVRDAGVDVTARNAAGATPLDLARRAGWTSGVQLLESAASPRFEELGDDKNEDAEVVRAHEPAVAPPPPAAATGPTPMQEAAARAKAKLIESVLDSATATSAAAVASPTESATAAGPSTPASTTTPRAPASLTGWFIHSRMTAQFRRLATQPRVHMALAALLLTMIVAQVAAVVAGNGAWITAAAKSTVTGVSDLMSWLDFAPVPPPQRMHDAQPTRMPAKEEKGEEAGKTAWKDAVDALWHDDADRFGAPRQEGVEQDDLWEFGRGWRFVS